MYYYVLGEAVLTAGDLPPEAQLKEALLEHYDASVRPTYNTTEATRVVMDLALQQIIDVVGISSFFQPCTYTLQEENLHWSLIFALSLVPNSLNLNCA